MGGGHLSLSILSHLRPSSLTHQDYEEEEEEPAALGTAALVGAPIPDASEDEDFESGEEEDEV